MEGLPCRGINVIRKAEELALLPHYFAEGCIMNMADLREEVMLYLEVQATYKPGNYLVPGSKVGSGPDLVDGPFGINKLMRSASAGHIEFGFFNHMRQLKHYGEGKPHGKMDDQKTDQPRLPTQYIDRQQDIEESI